MAPVSQGHFWRGHTGGHSSNYAAGGSTPYKEVLGEAPRLPHIGLPTLCRLFQSLPAICLHWLKFPLRDIRGLQEWGGEGLTCSLPSAHGTTMDPVLWGYCPLGVYFISEGHLCGPLQKMLLTHRSRLACRCLGGYSKGARSIILTSSLAFITHLLCSHGQCPSPNPVTTG